MGQKRKQNQSKIWTQLQKGILQVFSASVINKIVAMFSNMVLTRMLAQNEYGIWSYVLNFYSYAHLIMGLGLVAGALQFGAENRDTPEENRFYRYCAMTGLAVNFAVIVLFISVSFTGILSIRQAGVYVRVYLPIILLEYLLDLLMTILRCKNRFGIYSKLLTLNTVLVAVCTCLGAVWGVGGVIAGKYLAATISLLIIICAAHQILSSVLCAEKLNAAQKKELWHYSIFNGISSVLSRFLYLIDVSMIAVLLGSTTELAIYKVATLIPNALTFIPGSVIICILPDVVANNRNLPWLKRNIKKTFQCLLAVNLLLSLLIILFAPLIIRIVSGEQYLSSVEPFRILIAGYCISGTFRSLSVNVLAALRAVRFNVICGLLMCAADIGLNLLFIPQLGMTGAAYATFGGEFIGSVLSFGYLICVLRKRSL